MTSSTDFTLLVTPELRSGDLTRFGGTGLLGDSVTELALSALVEDARSAARSQGYAVGWAEGRREAAAEAQAVAQDREREQAAQQAQWLARQQTAVQALTSAAQSLSDACAEAESRAQTQAVELARELVETILGHELRRTDEAGDTGADLAARVLAAVSGPTPYVVRVHPEVAATVAGLTGARVVPDVALSPADAVVEIDDQVVDLRVSTALARVREVLS